MALDEQMLDALMNTLLIGGKSVASFGYPDIVIGTFELSAIVGSDIMKKVSIRKDSAEICKRHNTEPHDIVDTASLFAAHDTSLTVFDIVEERGGEIYCDLNKPINSKYYNSFDVVLDPGTLEHCFNVGQAAFNMANVVRLNGRIIHSNPFMSGNHGFYGINPTWYADFYGQNGFEITMMAMQTRAVRFMENTMTGRFIPTTEYHNFVIARRKEVKALQFPTQTKYQKIFSKIKEKAA